MALNIPGLMVMVLFYLLVLGTGIWASIKSKQVEKRIQGDRTEMTLLGNRRINLVVGVFTMTGESIEKFPIRLYIVASGSHTVKTNYNGYTNTEHISRDMFSHFI